MKSVAVKVMAKAPGATRGLRPTLPQRPTGSALPTRVVASVFNYFRA